MNNVVILAAGDFPQHSIPLAALRKADLVVCCDGAATTLISHGYKPDVIVGDLDSLPRDIKENEFCPIVLMEEQDTNDLCKAFRYVLEQDFNDLRITILGATGKREDHSIGNIFHLLSFGDQAYVEMLTDYGRFLPCTDEVVLKVKRGQQISVFAPYVSDLHSEGLKWPLHDLHHLWEGTLNEACSEEVRIKAKGDFLVYISHEMNKHTK